MQIQRDGERLGQIFQLADTDGDGILILEEFLTLAEKFAAVLPSDVGLAHLTYEAYSQVCDEHECIDVDGFLVWFVSMAQASQEPLTKILDKVLQTLTKSHNAEGHEAFFPTSRHTV